MFFDKTINQNKIDDKDFYKEEKMLKSKYDNCLTTNKNNKNLKEIGRPYGNFAQNKNKNIDSFANEFKFKQKKNQSVNLSCQSFQ